MGHRGQQPFEERIGVPYFKELIKRLDIGDLAELFCEHNIDKKDKRQCKACRRSIYRARKRVQEREASERSYKPMEDFSIIPEVIEFRKYVKDVKGLKGWKVHMNFLERFWNWIKEDSELAALERPALWDKRHVKVIIARIRKQKIALYAPKQTLRRWFEFRENMAMLKDTLLKASRHELRSPKGTKRKIRRFTPSEYNDFIKKLDPDEAFTVNMHVALKCRTQNLFTLTWDCVDWKDTFYGFPMVTISVHQTKAKGGVTWKHCPVDLWFSYMSKELRHRYENRKSDRIIPLTRGHYEKMFQTKVSELLGRKVEPYDCRRSPSGWLRDLGLSELAIGQYVATSGEGFGFCGCGWENPEIYYNRYGVMNPLAIYNKDKRLDVAVFDGHIKTILENR